MTIRVPLVGLGMTLSTAVLHRLDTTSTRAVDPPGDPPTGYDEDFDAPVTYQSGTTRTSARRELTAVRVPCQVETPSFRLLEQYGPGVVERTRIVLVTHRQQLESLGLIDGSSREVLIRKGDRVSAIERYGVPGTVQMSLPGDGLFVFEVRPGSLGFGPEGHDLELVFLQDRPAASG